LKPTLVVRDAQHEYVFRCQCDQLVVEMTESTRHRRRLRHLLTAAGQFNTTLIAGCAEA
jgi:hypothetical protein